MTKKKAWNHAYAEDDQPVDPHQTMHRLSDPTRDLPGYKRYTRHELLLVKKMWSKKLTLDLYHNKKHVKCFTKFNKQ